MRKEIVETRKAQKLETLGAKLTSYPREIAWIFAQVNALYAKLAQANKQLVAENDRLKQEVVVLQQTVKAQQSEQE